MRLFEEKQHAGMLLGTTKTKLIDGSGDDQFRFSDDLTAALNGRATDHIVHVAGNARISASVEPTVQTSSIRDVDNDFNGDGRSDVLWFGSNGDVTNWLGQANGGFIGNVANSLNNPGVGWSAAGTGDFNGDGRDDILWRNAAGDVTNWLGEGNGNFVGNVANSYANPGSGHTVVGIGDFNGDGRDDILWRSIGPHGPLLTQWLGQANGSFLNTSATVVYPLYSEWSVVGTGDFNGDGRDDILLRNVDGYITNWLGQADGRFVGNSTNSYNRVGSDWTVGGTGDFNGDGRDDVLWVNANGDITNWLGQANGNFVGNIANSYNNPGAGWSVAGTGDFNGDGRDDVLWRHTNGNITNWLGEPDGDFIGNIGNSYNNPGGGWNVRTELFF